MSTQDAAQFTWTLTEYYRHLIASGWSAEQALPKVFRSIGDGEVPFRVFEKCAGKLISRQPGQTGYWLADVRLRLVHEDANGNPIDPEVQPWPAGPVGWDQGPWDLVWRVPEDDARRVAVRRNDATLAPIPEDMPPRQRRILRRTEEVCGPEWRDLSVKDRYRRVRAEFEAAGEFPLPGLRTCKRAWQRR